MYFVDIAYLAGGRRLAGRRHSAARSMLLFQLVKCPELPPPNARACSLFLLRD
jgi:hypothetical protein